MDTRPAGLDRPKDARRSKPRMIRFSTTSPEERVREWRSLVGDIERELKRRGMSARERKELRRWIDNGA